MTRTPKVSPLAENRWLRRRLYVFAASAGVWTLLAWAVRRVDPVAMPRVAEGLMGLLGLLLVLYLVAPTAQQMIEMLVQLRLRLGKRGGA